MKIGILNKVEDLFNLFEKGETIYAIGGLVKEYILKKKLPSEEIDLISPLSPQKTFFILKKQNINFYYKKEFGTFAFRYNNYRIELACRRIDILKDSDLSITFTNSYLLDAIRRDLTINAIYMNKEGKIYSPFQGEKDLREGIVRFIGKPLERIKEDPTRILRYFRYYAEFAKVAPSSEILKSCLDNYFLISKITSNNIMNEIRKIYKCKNYIIILKLMKFTRTYYPIFTTYSSNFIILNIINNIEKKYIFKFSFIIKLFISFNFNVENIFKLILTTKEKKKIIFIKKYYSKLLTPDLAKEFLYLNKKTKLNLEILLLSNIVFYKTTNIDFFALINIELPKFPLKYNDISNKDHKFISEIHKWWITKKFQPSKSMCYEYLKKLKEKTN